MAAAAADDIEFDFDTITQPDVALKKRNFVQPNALQETPTEDEDEDFDLSSIAEPIKDRKQLLLDYAANMKAWAKGGGKGPRPLDPYDPRAIVERQAKRGVSQEGAPASVRSLVSLAPEGMQGPALQRLLVKHFKKPVRLREGEQGAEYSTDNGKSWTVANPLGLDVGDITAMRGTAVSLGGSLAGAGGGAKAGGVPGAILGGAFGTFLGEMGRFEEAKLRGVIPKNTSDLDLAKEALPAAVADAVGGTVLLGLVKAYKLYKAGGTGALKNLDVGKLEEDLAAARAKVGEIEKESGQRFPVTTGQTMRAGEARDVVLSVEEKVQREVPQGRLAAIENEQRQAQRALESNLQSKAPPPTRSNMDIGEDVRTTMGAEPRAELATQEAIVSARQAELDRVAQEAVNGNLTAIDAGRVARDAWSEGKTAIQNAFHDRYDAMAEKHGGIAISPIGVRRVAIRHKRVLDSDLFPSLAPDDRTLIKDVLKQTQGNKPISLGTAQRALSALREEMRLMRKGVSSRRGIKEVQELHDAILNARNAAIERVGPNSTNPVRLDAVLKLEADYARSKEMIDRSALGQLLRTKEGGGWVIPDDEVVQRTLSSESDMNEIVGALRDPAYAQHLGGERTLKRGVFGLYEREVMRDGKINPAAHTRFIEKYGDAMKRLLSPDEMKRIQAPGGAAKLLKVEEEKLTELTRYMNKQHGVKMQDWDASAIVSELWNPTGLERLNATMAKVRSVDPALADELRGAIAVRLRKDFSDYNAATGEWLPDPKRMSEFLHNPEWTEAVSSTFGQAYLRGLKVLHDAQVFANATPVKRAQGGPMEAVWKPHKQIWAMLTRVGIAPPLSRAGRAQTGALQQKVAWNEARLDRLLSDPQAMIDMLKLRRLSPTSAAGSAVLADLARRLGADDVDLELAESAQ